jgi:hypothetical protein
MRRSTLWMCALLVTTTFGCERIKPRVAPIGAAFSNVMANMMAAVKEKIELVRVRFLHKKAASAPAPAPPAAPVAARPATPAAPPLRPARPAPAHPAPVPVPTEPVPQIPVVGPARLRDVPYVSQDTGTVYPGMAERDVYSLWGAPVAVRHLGEFTYLYFPNGCEYSCGHLDVVTLQNGQVIDAIVRWPGHGYGGPKSNNGGTLAPPPEGDNLRMTPDTTQTKATTPE